MKKIIPLFLLLAVSFQGLATDMLQLNNGMLFSGEVKQVRKCEVKFKTSLGESYWIPAQEIQSIGFGDLTSRMYLKFLSLTDDSENCLAGRLDGAELHGKKGAHFALGFFFGAIPIIFTAVMDIKPERGKRTPTESQNQDLFDDPEYLECYNKEAKKSLIIAEAIGLGVGAVFSLVANTLDIIAVL